MATVLEDRPTVVLPRITTAFRPPVLGPLLRALAPALVAAAVLGLILRGPAAVIAGAGLTMVFVGVALFRVIRSADRGY